MSHQIRYVQPKDMNEVVELCAAHAAYEQADYQREGKVKELSDHLFSPTPKLIMLVVEMDQKLIGYASYMKQYSTWDAAEYIYMDCLYLTAETRGMGIGEQLMRRIQKEAQQLNCEWIQWQTPDFNHRAIKFYQRIGATVKSKERFFLNSSPND